MDGSMGVSTCLPRTGAFRSSTKVLRIDFETQLRMAFIKWTELPVSQYVCIPYSTVLT